MIEVKTKTMWRHKETKEKVKVVYVTPLLVEYRGLLNGVYCGRLRRAKRENFTKKYEPIPPPSVALVG